MSIFIEILCFIGWGTAAFLIVGLVGFALEALLHRLNRPRNAPAQKMPYDSPGDGF